MRFKKVLGEKLDGVEGFGKRVREKGLGMGDGVEGFEKRFGRRVREWGMGWKGLRRGSGAGSGNGVGNDPPPPPIGREAGREWLRIGRESP